MPPSSRYLHNLRVIQRHDPTITTLFDQFPHVCVYHHKGDEWQKKGCEGAMFLFERCEEPKYGFYILNRNNTGDYIQRMTPDDDVEFASAYLIYRAFGKVTCKCCVAYLPF
ncbi:Dcp1-like decapping family-domain-containing protein [Hysterangium stoloniferum]|nr:Dcp1-like decapping family-domain-containing protein [Hysterangium stoloniferum]